MVHCMQLGFSGFNLHLFFRFLSLKIDFVSANSDDPDELCHFIWVFTVCQSTCLEVSGLQRVNACAMSNIYL